MEKAIVLLSGGLDSTVATWLLRPEIEPVLALTADYGQKAARQELAASYALATEFGIPHRTVFLPFLREASASVALIDRERPVPEVGREGLDDDAVVTDAAAAVWVPNRNGVLVGMAATWAEANDVRYVACGFNREEARTFPDNSGEFVAATNAALALSTRNRVELIAPTIEMDKTEIARRGHEAGAPLHRCWSCYLGQDDPCERCESCQRFRRALEGADLPYANGRMPRPEEGES